MASPQPDRFTRISNELLEALVQYGLSGNEWRVVMFIVRMTYGYQKKVINLRTTDLISGTGILKQNINRVLNGLLSSNILLSNQSEDKIGVTYGIQKDYDKWKVKGKKRQKVIKVRTKSNQSEDTHPYYIKEKRKEPIRGKNNSLPKIETLKQKYSWLDLKLWSDFREHRKSLKKYPFTTLAEIKAIGQLKSLIDKGYSQKELIDASIINCWRGIFEPFKKQEENFKLGDF